jgi:hypothetical protein
VTYLMRRTGGQRAVTLIAAKPSGRMPALCSATHDTRHIDDTQHTFSTAHATTNSQKTAQEGRTLMHEWKISALASQWASSCAVWD